MSCRNGSTLLAVQRRRAGTRPGRPGRGRTWRGAKALRLARHQLSCVLTYLRISGGGEGHVSVPLVGYCHEAAIGIHQPRTLRPHSDKSEPARPPSGRQAGHGRLPRDLVLGSVHGLAIGNVRTVFTPDCAAFSPEFFEFGAGRQWCLLAAGSDCQERSQRGCGVKASFLHR